MLLFHQLIRLFLRLLIALDSIIDHHLFWRLHIGTLILLRHPPTVDFFFHWLIYLFRRLLMNYLVLFLVDLLYVLSIWCHYLVNLLADFLLHFWLSHFLLLLILGG